MNLDIIKKAKSLIQDGSKSSFSFDIFDTFILRRCVSPDGVYERAFALAPIPASHQAMSESFIQNRVFAETKARQNRYRKESKPEVTIDDIYGQYPIHHLGLPRDARPLLADAEFRAELDLCFVNPDIYGLMQDAKAKGLRVGFISDTYWSKEQLDVLLRHVAPDIDYDFIYPSCEFGLGKTVGLFQHYLKEQSLEAGQVLHIGDNPVADIAAANQLGIEAIHYPQAPAPLFDAFRQEAQVARMLRCQRADVSTRLDGGLSVMRRLAVADLPADAQCLDFVGTAVLGPIMVAFHKLIEQRVAQLSSMGKKVEVLFLARDGFLPFRLWEESGTHQKADYVEINRRITVIGCANGPEALQKVFKDMEYVDNEFIRAFLKEDIPAINRFFEIRPVLRGRDFAKIFPDLVSSDKLKDLCRSMRDRLIGYLRDRIFDFDQCTDLVLVDLGYSGTIQRALRPLFDLAGISMNVHGIYLLTHDQQFADLAPDDTVTSLIDDTVVTPQIKFSLQRNIALLEQLCAAPVGSVRDYDGTAVLRERDMRSPEQLLFCSQVQEQCLRFYQNYRRYQSTLHCDPLAASGPGGLWAAIILCRQVLLPTPIEQKIFGDMKHDGIIDMANTGAIDVYLDTMSLPDLHRLREPPMWMSGSLAGALPLAAQLYALAGFGIIGDAELSDVQVGKLDASLIKGNEGSTIPVSITLTPFGLIRLRAALLQKHTDAVLAIPLEGSLRRGAIRAVAIQEGNSGSEAVRNRELRVQPWEDVRGLGCTMTNGYFEAAQKDAHLLVTIPPSTGKFSILTLTLAPLPLLRMEVTDVTSQETGA